MCLCGKSNKDNTHLNCTCNLSNHAKKLKFAEKNCKIIYRYHNENDGILDTADADHPLKKR